MDKDFELDLSNALDALRSGGVILYPTDTIWGLGCDACNQEAVAKIYSIKKREDSKSMLSLVGSRSMLADWVSEIPDELKRIMDESDSPVTCIYPTPVNLAENLLADDGSAGLRVTGEDFSSRLCLAFGKPIVSTSANISGEAAPRFFDEVDDEIRGKVDYIVRYRQDDTTPRSASRIVKILPDNTVLTIR